MTDEHKHADEELCGEIANKSTGETCALVAGHKSKRHFTRRALDRQKERIRGKRQDPEYRAEEITQQTDYYNSTPAYRESHRKAARESIRRVRARRRESEDQKPGREG